MYGYRQSNQNGLMANLNSISSSLSSIDTVSRRPNVKASADNLLSQRCQSVASTSLLWRSAKEDRYATTSSIRNSIQQPDSEIYYVGRRNLSSYCLDAETSLNLILAPLLLLTIIRQIFDFLGQIWLQIIINLFTIIFIIIAIFGIKQRRISYLASFSLVALFNTVWNVIVVCIYTKFRDVGLNEDALAFYTGSTSWWRSNGPGCSLYNINPIQPSIRILQPNIITNCRVDYHLIESAQACIHAGLFFISTLLCCCTISNIRRYPHYKKKTTNPNSDRVYRLNHLAHDRSRVNQNPAPGQTNSRFSTNASSLNRSNQRTSSRSSQHSISSMRSARRRNRQSECAEPRNSTSSMQRSQKYGSISSRRSSKKDKRSDMSSLTYGRTGGDQRTRLSSLSSADYLPSYQPPHSSNANLLSSYGEISSIDSYQNRTERRSNKVGQGSMKRIKHGNTNPTYTGSRSSVCSQNANANNYDDLYYIYNNDARNNENLYGPSSSISSRQQTYQKTRNGFVPNSQQNNSMRRVRPSISNLESASNDINTRPKITAGSFQSFTANSINRSQHRDKTITAEINNNSLNINNLNQQPYTNQRNSRHPIYSNQMVDDNGETPI